MSTEHGVNPEGEGWKAPEDRPKEKKGAGIFKGKVGRALRGMTAGLTLFGGGVAMQQQAKGEGWADKLGKVTGAMTEMSRESNRHGEELTRAQNERIRDALQARQELIREATRLEQERLRIAQDQEREKTERQRDALNTVERTGATEVESATIGGKTSVKIIPGNTSGERIQAEGYVHEKQMEELRLKHAKEMEILKQQQEFLKNRNAQK